jgi:streptogrisin B
MTTRLAAVAAALLAATAPAVPRSIAAPAGPRPADHGSVRLAEAGRAMERADVPGTAWVVRAGRLEVSADATVTGSRLDRVRAVAGRFGGAVRVRRTAGRLAPMLSGGDLVLTGSRRCALGFNAHRGSTYFFLTAGHCTSGFPDWFTSDGTYIGPTAGTSFPGNDYGLVQYADPSLPHPSAVGSQPITGWADAHAGEHVCTRDVTNVVCGTVRGVNATVNYGTGGVVSGLIDTDICVQPGDSGAPLYDGSTALGTLSGGSPSGCESYFQPIGEAMSAYGLTL